MLPSIMVAPKYDLTIKIRAEEANRTIREYVEYLFAKDKVAKEVA